MRVFGLVVLLIFLVGLACASPIKTGTLAFPFPPTTGGHECPDKQEYCPDDATCCPDGAVGGGYLCCQTTNVPSGTCCGGGCCTDGETCCSDSQGSECCIQQDTFCVAKDPSETYPSRCCPRYTIGCRVGTVGCCDPAQPWQWSLGSSKSTPSSPSPSPSPASSPASSSPEKPTTPPSNLVAYTLFMTGYQGLDLVSVNISSGKVISTQHVADLDDNPAGETTRDFLYNKEKFYYLDANFTANGGNRPSTGREAYLYTIDAQTAQLSKATIQGAVDYPIGYTMDPTSDNILMATKKYDGDKAVGFNYYVLDPSTAQAKLIGSIARGSGESDNSYYAGFHRAASADGKTVYRVGYQYVSTQSEQGLGVAGLAANNISYSWSDEVSPQHDFYMTLDSYHSAKTNTSSNTFISLAPSLNSTQRDFDLVQWSEANPSQIKVLATLGNAHPPRELSQGSLGFLNTYLNGHTYLALVASYSTVNPILDVWSIVHVDLQSGDYHVAPLQPYSLAGSSAAAGLGLSTR